jgi:thiol-disulfide isomerase/thioredoxin
LTLPGSAPLNFLAFFKSTCPTCATALPFVRALHERAPERLRVLGVAQDEEPAAQALAEVLGLEFPIGLESVPWNVSASYGLVTVPTFFLVNAEGEILVTSPGLARDELREIGRRAADAGGEPIDPILDPELPAFVPG